ncbi:CHAT domain-containing protein [Spirosoma pollinicola]|nr:CHAT domain-containing protein [Spirosoma pollinicola]
MNRFELASLCKEVLNESNDQKIKKLPHLLKQWEQNRVPPDSLYVNLHIELAKLVAQNKHWPEAIQLLKKVIRLYPNYASVLNPEILAKAYHRLGISYQDNGDFISARRYLEQGIVACRDRPDSRWVSYMHSTLAFGLYQSGDYEKALIHAEQAIRIGESVHSDRAVANGLFEKAKALRELGHTRETRPDLERAIYIAEHNQELVYDLSLYYVTLAYVCKAEAKAQQGIHYFQKAISLSRQLNDSLGIATNSTDFGYFLYELRQYDAAETVLTQAILFSQAPYITARAFNNLGAVYWRKKNLVQALKTYQRGFSAIFGGFNGLKIDNLPSISSIRSSAYKEYVFTLIQDKADTWLDYAKATNSDSNRLKAALDTYKVADQMVDFMRWEHTGDQSKLFWRQKTRGMYERAIETCYRLGDAKQAFRFLEKSRAVMLADKINELGAQHKLTNEQVAQEQLLQQSVNNQQSKLASIEPGNSSAYNAARILLFAKQDSLTTFLKKLEASNPAYYQYKYDNSTTSLADVQQYLKKQSGSLITYFVGDSALYLMGVTDGKILLKKQSIKTYNQLLRQFGNLLSNPTAMSKRNDVARFLSLSNGLYQQLLGPMSLPEGRVVVSPDGFFVPFDALSRSATRPDYAMNDYAFSYVYSVGLLLKNEKKSVQTAGFHVIDFLGIAPVDFSPSLKQVVLPGSDNALVPIASRFTNSTLLTHNAATRQAFLSKAANARIIHLFTHATADSTDQEPKLYFADSTLQLSDLSNEALPNAQLVVLAACKTGIGANQRGEGIFSLARGFAALGVPSVLTTLWSVQNVATYQLTDLFYSYLDQGFSKDIALQRAKQDWLKTAEGVNQLPNNWAGLIIVGDSEPLPRLGIMVWVSVLFAFLGAAILIIWHERRKRKSSNLIVTAPGALA